MKLLISFLFLLFTQLTFAQDAVIAVGTAEQDLDKLVIDDPEIQSTDGDHKRVALEITDILRNNFVFYKHKFNVINFEEKGKKSFSEPKVEEWKSHGVTFFIASSFKFNNKNIKASFKVWSISTSKEILNQTFNVDGQNLRPAVHTIADTIYRQITGKASIFKSKIVFISDRTSEGRDIIKELYVMDFDGRRVEKLTNFNSVVLSPSISPDNSKIIFSLIATHKSFSGGKTRSIKNIDLKMLDLNSGKFSTISQKPGINSGAIFSGTGDRIYLTLSFSGNADVYEMGLDGTKMRKVTSHYSDDVDPSITQDGSLMSFLSNRPGRAHIYTMDPSGVEKDVKRISFVGQFNATPRFSPDGKEIVFTSWVDNGFDLYRIGSDGNHLARLTKDFGSNEEPVYSPDGEFIVFTSNKLISRSKATQDLYIMNRNGEILGQLTQGFGKCLSPQWTNVPK